MHCCSIITVGKGTIIIHPFVPTVNWRALSLLCYEGKPMSYSITSYRISSSLCIVSVFRLIWRNRLSLFSIFVCSIKLYVFILYITLIADTHFLFGTIAEPSICLSRHLSVHIYILAMHNILRINTNNYSSLAFSNVSPCLYGVLF